MNDENRKNRERCQLVVHSMEILKYDDNKAKCLRHRKISIYETQKMFEMGIYLKKEVDLKIFLYPSDIYLLLMGKFLLGSLLH